MSLRRIELRLNVNLKQYTTIKIGGKAKYFFDIHSPDDLRQVIADFGPSFYILGGGSNLIIENKLIEKPVLKLADEFSYIKKETDNYLKVGASTPLSFLLKYCLINNLGGLEGLAGIPATIGGLLLMNASSFGACISSCLEDLEAMDKKGKVNTFSKKEIAFDYRFSSLRDYIIMGARFKFLEVNKAKINLRNILRQRFTLQEFRFPSCGCVFKNPQEFAAGFLIESCGLRGLAKGDAQISPRHANFIINLNAAKYLDVDYLIQIIKERVYKKYSIILEEEIKRWA